MNFNLEQSFDERFREYEKLNSLGEYYVAALELVQISHCLSDAEWSVRDKWTRKLQTEQFSDVALQIIKAEILKDVNYIKHVLSIGEEWNSDEILLVLQQRVFIDLFSDFLLQFYGIDLRLSVEEIDELIQSTAKTKQNKLVFELAIRLMRKNWGLPIKSKWLDDELIRG